MQAYFNYFSLAYYLQCLYNIGRLRAHVWLRFATLRVGHDQGSSLPMFATPRVLHSQGSPLPGFATPRVPRYILYPNISFQLLLQQIITVLFNSTYTMIFYKSRFHWRNDNSIYILAIILPRESCLLFQLKTLYFHQSEFYLEIILLIIQLPLNRDSFITPSST